MRRLVLATVVSMSLASFVGASVAQESVSQTAQATQSLAESFFEKGMSAQRANNDDEAHQYFKKAAELGHAEAQFLHGSHLLELRANNEAQKWVEKAAKNGSVLAQTMAGERFLKGDGFEKNPGKGMFWLAQAANSNDPKAQHLLGKAYLGGYGVKMNLGEAIKWLTKSSEQKFAPALIELSFLYASGIGGKPDYEKSTQLIAIAAATNDPEALTIQGTLFFADKKYQLSAIAFEKAAMLGSSIAQFSLGEMYRSGIGVKQDIKKSNELITQAAQNGHAEAQFLLFSLYRKGVDLPKNEKIALQWLERAVEQDYLNAQVAYSVLLVSDKEYHQAFQVLQKAVKNKGDYKQIATAQFLLGELYATGRGTRQDLTEALKWTKMGASGGNVFAQNSLGDMYEMGIGTKQHLKLAKFWFGRACDSGYQVGCDSYRRLNEQGVE